jgi:hypothetical protein
VTPLIEAGKVFIPDKAPWIDAFLDETASFPNGQFDDSVDSVIQALNYLRAPRDRESLPFTDSKQRPLRRALNLNRHSDSTGRNIACIESSLRKGLLISDAFFLQERSDL